jgi:hypothetical protein
MLNAQSQGKKQEPVQAFAKQTALTSAIDISLCHWPLAFC